VFFQQYFYMGFLWINKNVVTEWKKTRLKIIIRRGILSLLFMEKCELLVYI